MCQVTLFPCYRCSSDCRESRHVSCGCSRCSPCIAAGVQGTKGSRTTHLCTSFFETPRLGGPAQEIISQLQIYWKVIQLKPFSSFCMRRVSYSWKIFEHIDSNMLNDSFTEVEESSLVRSEKLKNLGWKHRTLEETLVDSIKYYQDAVLLHKA